MHIAGHHRVTRGLLLVIALAAGFAPPRQQANPPAIALSVSAGYDGLFRENQWFPLLIRVSNDGDDVAGRLVVRPSRAGSAFTNTFSAPVEMPAGSRKDVFLYVTARSFATEVRVEFIDDAGVALAEGSGALRNVLYQDQLDVVLTQSSAGSVDLTGVRSGGFAAFQANWLVENIPDEVAALNAVDRMLISDIDTGPLTTPQREALADWVAGGGHLIVTGGANWQATSAGLIDLLPLKPEASNTVNNLDALAGLAGAPRLRGDTVIATGPLAGGASLLAAAADDLPLVARRQWGLGTVDYLAVDPLAQPLRDWDQLNELWFTLATTTEPHPAWAYSVLNPDRATSAVEVLPGLNLLPDVLPLCGFLAAYIALIGPLNYLILNRINRREWAWLSIPLLIAVFSALAWVVGFNLRGNIATLSRIAVVQTWPDTERAQVNGLVGLLSPRRSNYTLTMTDGSMLRPIARSIQPNPFAASVQASTDIQQSGLFRVDDFTVDASFIAAFSTSSTIDRPAISGQASLFYQPPGDEEETGRWMVRGSVRNNSSETISDPVILARGVGLPLDSPLAPGDIQTFEVALASTVLQPPAPSPLERNTGEDANPFLFSRYTRDASVGEQTIRDIMGANHYRSRLYASSVGPKAEDQENYRRQLFLSAFLHDQFQSTARGDSVYLAGWSDHMPLSTQLEGASWQPLDTTLYLVKLAVEMTPPTGTVLIGADQFTWVARDRSGLTSDSAPVNAVLQPGDSVTFQYTPLPDAVLSTVDTLYVELNTGTTAQLDLPVEVWDWQAEKWQLIDLSESPDRSSEHRQTIRRPQRFLGADNSVQVRLTVDEASGFVRLAYLTIEQEGEF